MYERIYNEAYHKHDAESLMWFEPNQFPDTVGILKAPVFSVGFEVPPGGEIGSPYHVLNDHTYCCAANATICAAGEPPASEQEFCKSFHDRKLKKRDEDAKRLGIPLFISEFGACLTEANCTPEINNALNAADRYQAGWAYWEFKKYADLTTSAGTGEEGFYNADGTLQHWKVKALSRSYMMYSQGVPTLTEFDMDSGIFNAAITLDTSIEAPSVLYTNAEYYYPNGKEVSFMVGKIALTEDQYTVEGLDQNYTSFTVTDKALNGQSLSIKVMPKLL